MWSSISGIMGLLSKEFIVLVILGSAIFAPLTYWGIEKWLQQFEYKISLSTTPFIIGLVGVLAIAIMTVSYKVFQAAIINPIDNLKKE